MATPRRRNRTARAAAVPEALASGTAATALNLRIDANLKQQVSDAAASAGLTLTDYVVKALNHLTDAPYNPWAAHPCDPHGSPRRRIVRADDIFDRDRELLTRAATQSLDLPTERVVVRLTVPRCLSIAQADLVGFKSWEDLSSDYVAAVKNSQLQIRRLHIYETLELPLEQDGHQGADLKSQPRAGAQLQSDRNLETLLHEASRKSRAPDRVHFRYTTVSDVMGYPGRRSDREYLNDFNVYGSFAVNFTLETSFGLPYTCMVSEFPSDIDYWTRRFDQLFERARRFDQLFERARPGTVVPTAP